MDALRHMINADPGDEWLEVTQDDLRAGIESESGNPEDFEKLWDLISYVAARWAASSHRELVLAMLNSNFTGVKFSLALRTVLEHTIWETWPKVDLLIAVGAVAVLDPPLAVELYQAGVLPTSPAVAAVETAFLGWSEVVRESKRTWLQQCVALWEGEGEEKEERLRLVVRNAGHAIYDMCNAEGADAQKLLWAPNEGRHVLEALSVHCPSGFVLGVCLEELLGACHDTQEMARLAGWFLELKVPGRVREEKEAVVLGAPLCGVFDLGWIAAARGAGGVLERVRTMETLLGSWSDGVDWAAVCASVGEVEALATGLESAGAGPVRTARRSMAVGRSRRETARLGLVAAMSGLCMGRARQGLMAWPGRSFRGHRLSGEIAKLAGLAAKQGRTDVFLGVGRLEQMAGWFAEQGGGDVGDERRMDLSSRDFGRTQALWALSGARLEKAELGLFDFGLGDMRKALESLSQRASVAVENGSVQGLGLLSSDLLGFGSVFPAALSSNESVAASLRSRAQHGLPLRSIVTTFLVARASSPTEGERALRELEDSARLLPVPDAVLPYDLRNAGLATRLPFLVLACSDSFSDLLCFDRSPSSSSHHPLFPGLELDLPHDALAPVGTVSLRRADPSVAATKTRNGGPRVWRAALVAKPALERTAALTRLLESATQAHSDSAERLARLLQDLSARYPDAIPQDVCIPKGIPSSGVLVLERARRDEVRALDVLLEYLHRPVDDNLHGLLDLDAACAFPKPRDVATEKRMVDGEELHSETFESRPIALESGRSLFTHPERPVVCGLISLCRALRRSHNAQPGNDNRILNKIERVALHSFRQMCTDGVRSARRPIADIRVNLLLAARANGLDDCANFIRSIKWDATNYPRPTTLHLLPWQDAIELTRAFSETFEMPDFPDAVAKFWYRYLTFDDEVGRPQAIPCRMVRDIDTELPPLDEALQAIHTYQAEHALQRSPEFPPSAPLRISLARYIFLATVRRLRQCPPSDNYPESYFEGGHGVTLTPVVTSEIQTGGLGIVSSLQLAAASSRLFRNPDGTVHGPAVGDFPFLTQSFLQQAVEAALRSKPSKQDFLDSPALQTLDAPLVCRFLDLFRWNNSSDEDTAAHFVHAYFDLHRDHPTSGIYNNPDVTNAIWRGLRIPFISGSVFVDLNTSHLAIPTPEDVRRLQEIRNAVAPDIDDESKSQRFLELAQRYLQIPGLDQDAFLQNCHTRARAE